MFVKRVVEAPPAAVKRPPVTVELAVERSPVDLQSVEVAEVQVTKSASLVKSASVMSERFKSSSWIEAQVATPAPLRLLTN